MVKGRKKGQISEPPLWLLAMIIGGMIVLVGYKAVNFTIERGEDSIAAVFMNDLKHTLGKEGVYTFNTPRRVGEVATTRTAAGK